MHAYLLRRAAGLDEARGGPGVRRRCCSPATTTPTAATPAWPSPASTPTSTRSSAPARRSPPTRPREIVQLGRRWRRSRATARCSILHEFHLLPAEAAAPLLKTIEEPPPSTTFVVLADFVPPELVTIASRCVRIDFRAIPDDVLAARLVAEGVDADAAADGRRRGRRRPRPGPPPRRRPGARRAPPRVRRAAPRGSTAPARPSCALVDELLGPIDAAAAPLADRHAAEVAELDARIAQFGERGSGRKLLEERHKRELRRHRTDELRSGLAVLAATYRDLLVGGGSHRPEALVAAVTRIHEALEALERNPNEPLLLQSLLWSLPAVTDARRSLWAGSCHEHLGGIVLSSWHDSRPDR